MNNEDESYIKIIREAGKIRGQVHNLTQHEVVNFLLSDLIGFCSKQGVTVESFSSVLTQAILRYGDIMKEKEQPESDEPLTKNELNDMVKNLLNIVKGNSQY